jgi:hypothetical protein
MKRTPCSYCGFLHRYSEPLPVGKKAICRNCSSEFVIETSFETPEGVKFLRLEAEGIGTTDCVGEFYYIENLKNYLESVNWNHEKSKGLGFKDVTCTLVPETDNEHDPNAVRVEIGGFQVANLSKRDAAIHRQYLRDTGKPLWQLAVEGTVSFVWDQSTDVPTIKVFYVELKISWSDT